MSNPSQTKKGPSDDRPVNKATMDQPQEEFIEPQGAHAKDERAHHESIQHAKASVPKKVRTA